MLCLRRRAFRRLGTRRQLERGFGQAGVPMAFLDAQGRWVRVNAALCALLARPEGDLLCRTTIEVTHPEDRGDVTARFAEAEPGVPIDYEKRFVRPDGSVRWVVVRATTLVDRGRVVGYFSQFEDISARREAEQRLRTSQRRLARSFTDASVGVVHVGLDGRVQRMNRALATLFGGDGDPALGMTAKSFLHPDEHERSARQLATLAAGDGERYRREARCVRHDGTEMPAILDVALVRDEAGAPEYFIIQIQDISARVAAQRREAALAELCRIALASGSTAELLDETTRIVAHALDAPRSGLLAPDGGTPLTARAWERDGTQTLADAAIASPGSVAQADGRAGVVVTGPAGGVFGVLAVGGVAGRTFDEEELGFLHSVASVLTTALRREAAESELRRRSLHDPLTGLPNRTLLLDRLRLALPRARRAQEGLAVLFIDVDDFKHINDSRGHDAGDRLLQTVAGRVESALRGGDTLARFGGDEFVALCEDVKSPEEALTVAARLLAVCAPPIEDDGEPFRITLSIGVAVLAPGGDVDDPEVLVRDADLAMYRAKGAGKGRYELFDYAMRDVAQRRVALTTDLDGAAQRGELFLAYQPLVALGTREVVGVEALLRWNHPERGLIGPDEFIPLAERNGLIVEIGNWVLREAARQATRWPDLRMSVNVSRRQLSDPEIVADVAGVLEEFALDPDRLVLEVTESMLMDEPVRAAATLEALAALGVRLALDDFGTGYSSLSSISAFPLTALKLDRTFLSDGNADEERWSIIRAVVEMARSMRLDIVAEGIETVEQRDALTALGCDFGQGFLFSRPVSPDDLQRLLQAPLPLG